MSYASVEHLSRFLEDFGTLYYGTRQGTSLVFGTTEVANITADLEYSASKIDGYLMAFGRVPGVPIGTNPKNGSYSPFLIEWNAYDTIFQKLKSRHTLEFKGGYPDWILSFGSRAEKIMNSLACGEITLDIETSYTGIGYPSKVAQSGFATFYSNWNSGFYSKSDYPTTFRIKITGTSDGNEIGQTRFTVSSDDGYSWDSVDNVTGTGWIDISAGLAVRWSPGTLTGTQRQIEYGDEWKISCTPVNMRTVTGGAQFKEFGRG